MVALYRGTDALAALDDIGVDRTLYEVINGADLLRLFLEYLDELLADDLALALGIFNAGKLIEKTLLCVNSDELRLEALSKYFFDNTVSCPIVLPLYFDGWLSSDACER